MSSDPCPALLIDDGLAGHAALEGGLNLNGVLCLGIDTEGLLAFEGGGIARWGTAHGLDAASVSMVRWPT
ncbi:hypothetical protein ACFWWC_35950 [Streptomyces sp. NPDC058642]|uniref:hypothetical protein n=1 Tax=Streptomyces sp. NPDC058642 TaxID=3346572 RepID=UPI00364EAC0D